MVPRMGSAIEHLRHEVITSRSALEGAAFFAALQREALPRDGYVSYLRACRVVFSAVEDIADPSLLHDADRAAPRIERELTALDAAPHRVLFDAELRAVAAAQDLTHAAMDAPGRTAGYLYGLTFLPRAAGEAPRWGRIEDALKDPRARREAVEGARAMLDALRWIVDALPPVVARGAQHAAHNLNPDAGGHEVSDDPRELEAALRASERAWREHAYYARRYGDRALRFIRSDSAWIASLARAPRAVFDGEVAWLARVLSARGMPTLLLERHLFALHDALVAAVPERAGHYAAIATAARELRARRRAAMPDARALDCARRFDLLAGEGLPGAGELIAGAVADERNGNRRAVPSLTAWLASPARFGDAWVRAVQRAVEEARGGGLIDYGSTEVQASAG